MAVNVANSMIDAAVLDSATFGLYLPYALVSSLVDAYQEAGGGGYGVLNAVNSLNPVNTLLTQGALANEEAGQALYLESLGDATGAQAHASGTNLTFESRGGFPRGPACASLGHAPWCLDHADRCGS